MKNIYIILFFLALSSFVSAQQLERFHPGVIVDGKELLNPWAGGLNKPQFSQADLNNDGIPDLYIFDSAAEISIGFEASYDRGELKYHFNPELVKHFPRVEDFALLRDYNGDGVPDLFCSHDIIAGIRVYTGYFENNVLKFNPFLWPDQNGLAATAMWFYRKNTNQKIPQLYVAINDIPAIYDVDGDGDLDVLTFDIGGFTVHWYKNYSVERGFGLDSFLMYQEETCWGGFYEGGLSPTVDLSPVAGECYSPSSDINDGTQRSDFRHAGSTLTALDVKGNGLTDLILGDVSFNELVLLINGGTTAQAWMIDQDDHFPVYDVPYNVRSFPAAFWLDVDLDGKNDLLVAPNSGGGYKDFDQVWYYKNISQSDEARFSLQQKDFLLDDMINLGSGTMPAFFDFNKDGLTDMLVGVLNRSEIDFSFYSTLYLFLNTGTKEDAKFTLIDKDFLNMSSYCNTTGNDPCAFMPVLTDINGDGYEDLFVTNGIGQIYYFENRGIIGQNTSVSFSQPVFPWMQIQAGNEAVPYFYDFDEDGDFDLFVGLRAGRIAYYENTGNEILPEFNADQFASENVRVVGGINTRGTTCIVGAAQIQIVYDQGIKKLVAGSDCNGLRMYTIGDRSIHDIFPIETNNILETVNEGRYNKTVFVDFENDGFLEMIIGNIRGGLAFYKTPFRNDNEIVSSNKNHVSTNRIHVYPNPAKQYLHVQVQTLEQKKFTIMDMYKRVLFLTIDNCMDCTFDIHSLPSGIYILAVEISGKIMFEKVIIE